MHRLAIIFVFLAIPATAESLCGETDMERLGRLLSGEWERSAHVSLESETLSILRGTPAEIAILSEDGHFATDFIDNLIGTSLELTLVDPGPYDVDRVDDVLEATGTSAFADALSDTPCGPETLPQLQGLFPHLEPNSADAGIGAQDVSGTVTLIPYFDDRILEIVELELLGPETLVFLTSSALMVPKRN